MRQLLSRALLPAALAAVLAVAACTDRVTGPGPDDGGLAQLRVTANVSGTPINTLVVTVGGPGIASPLVYNLQVQSGVATGTVKMPPGADRVITVQAYDANGAVTHTGSVTLASVEAGQNPPVTLTLTSSAGHVAVTVTFGAASVLVSPASDSLAPGDTLQLTATLLNPFGDTLQGEVQWATTNPARATVSATGQVIALDTGAVQIFATYEGIGGSAQLAVSDEPPPLDVGGFVWTGAVDTDWFVAGNWSGGVVPAATDTATVPAGPANMPLLTAPASIARIVVDSAATLGLQGFDLTVTNDAWADGQITGTTGRVFFTGLGTVRGRLPRLVVAVTARTTLNGNVFATAPLRVQAGRLRSAGFRLRAVSQ